MASLSIFFKPTKCTGNVVHSSFSMFHAWLLIEMARFNTDKGSNASHGPRVYTYLIIKQNRDQSWTLSTRKNVFTHAHNVSGGRVSWQWIRLATWLEYWPFVFNFSFSNSSLWITFLVRVLINRNGTWIRFKTTLFAVNWFFGENAERIIIIYYLS